MSLAKWFPPPSDKACLLKWSQVSLYLWENMSSGCHRNKNELISEDYDFHNSAPVVEHREKMLRGEWPSDGRGCEHCRDQEKHSGISDRIQFLQNDANARYVPVELLKNPTATRVKPTMLSVHFNNKCNMKCIYCGPNQSSAWLLELTQSGSTRVNGMDPWELDATYHQRLAKFYIWMEENYSSLKAFDILGGEPFIQKETYDCIDWMIAHPNLEVDAEIYSNLQIKPELFKRGIQKVKDLAKTVRQVEITASIDCWGPASEYIRFGHDRATFEENLLYMLNECSEDNIIIQFNMTVSTLSIPYTAELLRKIIEWNKIKQIQVNYNKCINPLMFDPHHMPKGTYTEHFAELLKLNEQVFPHSGHGSYREYVAGIFSEIEETDSDPGQILDLALFLGRLDKKRNTNWRTSFPWFAEIVDALPPDTYKLLPKGSEHPAFEVISK
jgi:sulfatase maturation enzyme AslB (radical SAM superfamily)